MKRAKCIMVQGTMSGAGDRRPCGLCQRGGEQGAAAGDLPAVQSPGYPGYGP